MPKISAQRTAALLALALMCGLSRAADRPEWFSGGSGSIISCATFVKVETEMTSAPLGQMPSHTFGGETWVEYGNVLEDWILGFVSGINAASRDGSKQIRVDSRGTIGWVRKFCEANPDQSLFIAAGRFVFYQQQQLK